MNNNKKPLTGKKHQATSRLTRDGAENTQKEEMAIEVGTITTATTVKVIGRINAEKTAFC